MSSRRRDDGRQFDILSDTEEIRLHAQPNLAVGVETIAHAGWQPAATGNDGRSNFAGFLLRHYASVRADI